jgi:hypothetical protein
MYSYPRLDDALAGAAAAAAEDDATPDDFVCPIQLERMRDPVLAADGHSYERAAIEAWLLAHESRRAPGGQFSPRPTARGAA